MDLPKKHKDLANLFRKLGAPNADKWASSQLDEGKPQLQRYLWLREAWKRIVPDDNFDWIDSEIRRSETRPDAPYAGIGEATKRCLRKGVDREDLKEIVRGMQAKLLFAICYMMDDPNFTEEEVKDLTWGLFQTDEDGNPMTQICALHESVLETDPTGREMRSAK